MLILIVNQASLARIVNLCSKVSHESIFNAKRMSSALVLNFCLS